MSTVVMDEKSIQWYFKVDKDGVMTITLLANDARTPITDIISKWSDVNYTTIKKVIAELGDSISGIEFNVRYPTSAMNIDDFDEMIFGMKNHSSIKKVVDQISEELEEVIPGFILNEESLASLDSLLVELSTLDDDSDDISNIVSYP